MSFEDKYVEVNGIRLHYVQSGSAGKTILFLHGFPEFWYEWREQLKEFGGDYTAIALDMRGYNLSDKPKDVHSYSHEKVVNDIKSFLKIVSPGKKAILVAHDWGGIIAWHFAMRHPDMLEKLVIINAPHPSIFANNVMTNQEQRKASAYIVLFRSEQAEAELSKDNFAMLCRSLFDASKKPEVFSEEDKKAYIEAWSQPGALTGALNYYRAPNIASITADATKVMLHMKVMRKPPGDCIVKVPTLVIWAEQDKALLRCNLHDLGKFVPKLKVVRVPEASHWVVHEEPELINRTIREYLQS